jgi:hypothetical protein
MLSEHGLGAFEPKPAAGLVWSLGNRTLATPTPGVELNALQASVC